MQGKMSKNKTPSVKPLYIVKLNLKEIFFYSVLNSKKEFESATEGYINALANAIKMQTLEMRK